ncbi:MAG: hypothetical protein ACI4IK_07910 [Eubacterium sp.]
MDFDNLTGAFGSDEPMENNFKHPSGKLKKSGGLTNIINRFKGITAENRVDIVCCSLIASALIAALCNWNAVMDGLFVLIFPVIKVLAKTLAAIIGVLCVGGIVSAGIRRRRRYY